MIKSTNLKTKKHHYTECGLDNIYLINGFNVKKVKNDEEILIQDIHGLHKAIGNALVFKRGLLLGNEIKFIRTTLDFSQKTLAKLLGLDYQSILSYEKDKTFISKTADRLLKALFYSYLNKDSGVYETINNIADFDAVSVKSEKNNQMDFKEDAGEWHMAA